MLTITEGLVGYKEDERNEKFSGSDSQENFLESLQTKHKDWYFANKEISYVRNNFGHRCKNLDDIDLNRYVLFVGCSHTEGIGLPVEDTYPYIASKIIKADYYNLGIGGIGVDIALHNLQMWLLKIKKPPRYIVWQWPFDFRFSINYGKEVETFGSWTDDKEILKVMLKKQEMRWFESKHYYAKEYLTELHKEIKILQIYTDYPADRTLYFHSRDLARDNKHYGPNSHRHLAAILSNYIGIKDK